jgi:hypothetical protein
MLNREIAPNKSLEIKGKMKKMLRIKESPNNLLKTQGRKGISQLVIENKGRQKKRC